ncbi:MAG: hypothetical protein JWN15_3335 [Firmicutes bacterium]|nr:hypothetical protein [Bacillota bacterium]
MCARLQGGGGRVWVIPADQWLASHSMTRACCGRARSAHGEGRPLVLVCFPAAGLAGEAMAERWIKGPDGVYRRESTHRAKFHQAPDPRLGPAPYRGAGPMAVAHCGHCARPLTVAETLATQAYHPAAPLCLHCRDYEREQERLPLRHRGGQMADQQCQRCERVLTEFEVTKADKAFWARSGLCTACRDHDGLKVVQNALLVIGCMVLLGWWNVSCNDATSGPDCTSASYGVDAC